MFKKFKVLKIVILSVVCFIAIFIFGFRSLTSNIYNQRSCEWANIDNLELHAKLNIPKIISSDCKYNQEQNIKKAYFQIDKNQIDIEDYIVENKFKKSLKPSSEISDKLLKFDEYSELSNLYYIRTNKVDDETSLILFDAEQGNLWITVEYADK